MNTPIKVSVVIPTYNRCDVIVRSIESVLRQSHRNLECIIVDDCSNDETETVIQGIKDSRVKYLKNNVRSGPAVSRNIGVQNATGSVIAFNDSDDIWKEGKLEAQLNVLMENDNYGMVYCPFLYFMGDIIRRIPNYDVPVTCLFGDIFDLLLEGNVIGTPTMLIKKECFLNVGGFDEELNAMEDYDLALRISREYKIGYVNECFVEAFCIDKGVNSHHLNALDAYIKILHKVQERDRKSGILSLMFQYLSLIEDQTIKSQLIHRVYSDLIPDKAYIDLVLEMWERRSGELQRVQTLITLISMADFSHFWKQFFQKMNIKNVAIYGCGRLGRVLADQFRKADIVFWGIIDREIVEYKGISIYSVVNIPEEIECIVITVYEPSFNKETLKKHTKARLMRIDEILKGRNQ